MDGEAWLSEVEARIKLDPDLWAYLQHQRNPGLPLIDRLPQPGDVIRDNHSPCELLVKRVSHTDYGTNFECQVIHDGVVTHHKNYHNGFDLREGRLLRRLKYEYGVSGWNIYNRGQDEIFILRRAKGQLDLFAF